MVAANDRGLDVAVVLDKSQARNHSLAKFLEDQGVPTRINNHYAIMHNKFMVIDNQILELGSFNYTQAAENKNAENVLVIHAAAQVVKDYAAQWQKLWKEGREL